MLQVQGNNRYRSFYWDIRTSKCWYLISFLAFFRFNWRSNGFIIDNFLYFMIFVSKFLNFLHPNTKYCKSIWRMIVWNYYFVQAIFHHIYFWTDSSTNIFCLLHVIRFQKKRKFVNQMNFDSFSPNNRACI